MPSKGQTVVSSATGERVVFQTLGRESGGELLRVDLFLAPGGAPRARHVHPFQEERFEILEGTVRFRLGSRTRVATAGDVVVVPPGTPHLPRNIGDGEAHLIAEVRPALNLETFLENAFALLSARGHRMTPPMILELSELLSHYSREVRATPALLYVLTLAAAPIGKSLGYRPRFPIEA
jgi:quercetin dioxygenase-like cupin family protein